MGNLLSKLFVVMYDAVPWLTVGVLSAAMPFIVMTGMHYALIPLFMNNIATLGFDVIVLVTMFCSNLAQGGAAFGVAFKTKDADLKSEGIACGISAFVAGVTEPALYGINLRFMTPMIGACSAAGIAGVFCGLTGVKGYTMGGSPSILSLITFIGGENPMHGVIFGAIAAVIIMAISIGVTFVLFKDPAPEADEEEEEAAPAEAPKSLVDKKVLVAPLTGTTQPLAEIPDAVFSSGALGEGAVIIPTVGKVVAPCDATVSATMDSKHAVGLSTADGMELLIHVGLNTVELDGKFYDCKVKEGDAVKCGDTLIEFDIDGITAAGYKVNTPVLVTNAEEYVSVKVLAEGTVKAGDELISVV